MSIIEAVNTLRDELSAGNDLQDSINWIVEEYGFRKDVIEIRFERAFGVAPSSFSPKKELYGPTKAEVAIAQFARRWQFVGNWRKFLGKKFYDNGNWYHFVAYDGKIIQAIDAATADAWNLSGTKRINNALKQIGAI